MPEAILRIEPLGFPWPTLDPFLFCVHHLDFYPKGDGKLRPSVSTRGRTLGNDFAGKDGWRMYHGEEVPGFPQHPHRGFETVTLVRKGLVDHSDSLGARARFGRGDAQWLTAGRGIVHAEMFPLVDAHAPNTLELFQIWLNLPAREKMCAPHFSMLWGEGIPTLRFADAGGRHTEVTLVAGAWTGEAKAETKGKTGAASTTRPLPPPPHSWAREADNQVAIWTLKLGRSAQWTLPPAAAGVNRMLYVFAGDAVSIDGTEVKPGHAVRLRADASPLLTGSGKAGGAGQAPLAPGATASDAADFEGTEMLLLQGKPIGEPVVQYGPFVMNTRSEIEQAFADYQRTRFGGWPFASDEPTHDGKDGRFAVHADGGREEPA